MKQDLTEVRNQLGLIDSLKKSEHYRAFLHPLLNRLSDEALNRLLEESIEPAERERRYQRYLAYRDVAGIIDRQEAGLRAMIIKEL